MTRPADDLRPRVGSEAWWAARWANPAAGSFLTDPAGLADTLLKCVGPAPVLDVGCGNGALLAALLARGVDARGVDACTAAVARVERVAPGRATVARADHLPFADTSFDTVVCTHLLDTLAESEIGAVLSELRRVTGRALLLAVRPGPDSEGTVTTARDRAFWERLLIDAGWRKHPLCQRLTSYAALEQEPDSVLILAQPLPPQCRVKYPASWLAKNRDLHMDMLREPGRRADAHVARYALACEHVRPGDVVLDAACGMGYGSAVLACGSEASRVIGVDLSEEAVAYARASFPGAGVPCEFHRADVARLSFLADESVDVVVSFETLEHVPDPAALLAEFRRVLTPGGRIIVSVPNDWADETGEDPNPHHLHVYTWERLAGELAREFLPERRWRQIAGGARKLTDRPRTLDEISLGPPFDQPPNCSPDVAAAEPEAEWWLALAMKSPVGGRKANYRESIFPAYAGADAEVFNISDFARDYDNPWLFRSLICIGPRMSHDGQRERLAREVIASARAGSPDRGGAVCVLAYGVLATPTPERITRALALIEDFDAAADGTPHSWRWRISNRYAAARLLLLRGDRAGARDQFLRCASMDVLRFSPLLATKTIDALRLAGILTVADGEPEAARGHFLKGLEEAQRVVQGSWVNIWGNPEHPQPYGMHEISQVMDLGSRCASWLGVLDRVRSQPGQAWMLAQRQSFSDMLSWVLSLQRNARWLEQQRANWERIATEREAERLRSHSWAEQLSATLASAQADAGRLRSHATELDSWNAELTAAKSWLDSQRTTLEAGNAHLTTELEKSRAWAEELQRATAWHQEQHALLRKSLVDAAAELEQTRTWAEELRAALTWHEGQKAAMEKALADAAAERADARRWTDDRAEAVKWHEQERARMQTALDSAGAELGQTRAWAEELAAAVAWHKEQAANWERTAGEQSAALGLLKDRAADFERIAAGRAVALDDATRRGEETSDRLASTLRELDAIRAELGKIESSRNTILREKSLLSAELSRLTSLPVHRLAIERWRNRNCRPPVDQNAAQPPSAAAS